MDWLSHFETNAQQRLSIPWESPVSVEAGLRDPLVRSLQRFQLGESGEGRCLLARAAATGDPAYREAVEHFVREEQEHARLLADVRRLGAPLLRRHWSQSAFVLLRRLGGLRLELMVLLVPEVLATCYFRAVQMGTEDPAIRAVCAQILRDEGGHVAFQCDTLATQMATVAAPWQQLARRSWLLLCEVTCLVFSLDHRSALAALDQRPSRFRAECRSRFQRAAAAIFGARAVCETGAHSSVLGRPASPGGDPAAAALRRQDASG